jgi:hypothetical protein
MNSSSPELCQLLTTTNSPLELLVVQPRGGLHGKHHLLLSHIVLGVFTDPLPRNKHPIVARVGSHGNVFTESLPNSGSICHNTLPAASRLMMLVDDAAL